MRAVLFACLLGSVLSLGQVSSSEAQDPSYLILRAPAAPHPHHPRHGQYPGQGYGVQTRTYAYGWFGVPPRRHWSRHFGYYRNYTEWSAR